MEAGSQRIPAAEHEPIVFRGSASRCVYDAATGLGTRQRIFMNGEEAGLEGRGLGTVVTGPDAGSSYGFALARPIQLGEFSSQA